MDRLKRDAILLTLIDRLRAQGSWCGETHVQKATFFLQEMLSVPTGFSYILYKHGPFSFELRDELTAMRADGFLTLQPRAPYGPTLVPDENARQLMDRFPVTLAQHDPQIRLIAERFRNRNVTDLERLATALYVSRQHPDTTPEFRAREIHRLKPHVSLSDAVDAITTIDDWARESRSIAAR